MGLLVKLGLRRPMKWERPTLLDQILYSPLHYLATYVYLIVLWLRGNPVRPPKHRHPIKIVCLSDTHDLVVKDVPDGDLLIHAGDLTNAGTVADIQKQINWLASLPHSHKVIICGNHDSWFDLNSRKEEDVLSKRAVDLKGMNYLCGKSVQLRFRGGRKLTVFGKPDLPVCGGPENAFQYLPQEQPWKGTIPINTDILVTHTPPKWHLDLDIGCPGLLEEVWRVKPTVHIFGHVHCARGVQPVFWDDCQKAYESLRARKNHGPISDMFPSGAWIDAIKILVHGVLSIVWQFVMLGGGSSGSVMVNAGCQQGNTGRLTQESPITIEI